MADATKADFPFMIGNSLPRSQFKSRVYQPILDQFAVRNMNVVDVGRMSIYDANKMKSQGLFYTLLLGLTIIDRFILSLRMTIKFQSEKHKKVDLSKLVMFLFTLLMTTVSLLAEFVTNSKTEESSSSQSMSENSLHFHNFLISLKLNSPVS